MIDDRFAPGYFLQLGCGRVRLSPESVACMAYVQLALSAPMSPGAVIRAIEWFFAELAERLHDARRAPANRMIESKDRTKPGSPDGDHPIAVT